MIDAVFHPRPWQSEILLCPSKRKVVLTGRQSGKTTLLKTIIYNESLSKQQQDILVLASTHGQVKENLWRSFTDHIEPLFHDVLIRSINNQDKIIELKNGSRISFKGTENVTALLGRTLDLVILDEWQDHSTEVWKYIEPMLAVKDGAAIFCGTARRGNQIMDFYKKGQELDSWRSWRITTEQSGNVSLDFLEAVKSDVSEEEYLQEYCCVPMSGEGLVYPSFAEENIIDDARQLSMIGDTKGDVLHIGVDFNISNMNAIVTIIRNKSLYIIDEIQLKHAQANTYALAKEIKRRYPGRKIILYPDATGRNRTTNTVDTQNTNHQILRNEQFNLKFDTKGNPPIEDRTILLNSKIRAMTGEITLYVNKKCTNIVYALQTRTYHNGKPIKDNVTDHGCDCLDYVVWHQFNTRNSVVQSGIYNKNSNVTPLQSML